MAQLKTKIAKARRVLMFEIECPHCEQAMEAPNGSLLWSVSEGDCDNVSVKCHNCGAPSNLPKSATAKK